MNEKDILKAKLKSIFEAALMEIPDEVESTRVSKIEESAHNPDLTRSLQDSHVGPIPSYREQSLPSSTFPGMRS